MTSALIAIPQVAFNSAGTDNDVREPCLFQSSVNASAGAKNALAKFRAGSGAPAVKASRLW